MNILICSKDPAVRQLTAEILMDAGFEVTLARDIQEALDQVELSQIRLVVLDVDGQNQSAWDLVEWVLDREASMPILCLTSAPRGAAWAWATAAEMGIAKPLQPNLLLPAVHRLLVESPEDRQDRCARQRMAVRYARPYSCSQHIPAAYMAWGIND